MDENFDVDADAAAASNGSSVRFLVLDGRPSSMTVPYLVASRFNNIRGVFLFVAVSIWVGSLDNNFDAAVVVSVGVGSS